MLTLTLTSKVFLQNQQKKCPKQEEQAEGRVLQDAAMNDDWEGLFLYE